MKDASYFPLGNIQLCRISDVPPFTVKYPGVDCAIKYNPHNSGIEKSMLPAKLPADKTTHPYVTGSSCCMPDHF